MQHAQLETRPLYGIGTVARLTGLKPDTLRVWERRYGLGASHKSATGRRQYTQSDLEHLQLIAALVAAGSRIGEIATTERKTLEMLVRNRGKSARDTLPERKPRAVFVGKQLCDWLDGHQGCIAGVDARLARVALSDFIPSDQTLLEDVDTLVVECPNLASGNVNKLQAVADHFKATKVIVSYQFGNDRWLHELESRGHSTTTFPPDPAYLAFEITRGIAEKNASVGEGNLGELMSARPRQFSENELAAARQLKSALDCECPRHISDLISALANFEAYSSSCSVENWHDAAVHSCIYAYTGQARHLMEKALQAVLEERGEEFEALLRKKQRSEGVGNAA
ncbi:MerR family transcriptional regulator [Chromatocurvus halotolerans]|uniref:MerR-like DNA binding protein n=1 Tax=Chromatocurvus halotolerans TaxID=1132028 RepID=A0A4R2KPU6_9GAMM|nr:MerR family transcriptional regulator [Chromatocurvus halotolerans]TCO75743.1 MerR-like DNA binding protein [Chromatocurvus halotolerans]